MANGNVGPIIRDCCPRSSHFKIKMIPPIFGFSVFQKRGETLAVGPVRVRFLCFTHVEESRYEVNVLHEFITHLPCRDFFGPTHDHRHLATTV